MDIYVIYKFDNSNKVLSKLKEIDNLKLDIRFFLFTSDSKALSWHKKSKKKIRECNQVLFFDSVSSNKHENVKNIKWELKTAEKYNKRIIVVKENKKDFSEQLYERDYSEKNISNIRYKVIGFDELNEYCINESSWNIQDHLIHSRESLSIDSPPTAEEYNNLLLEQYKIMIDTSEKLMNRRHSTGNLYTTICSAIIAFLGASFGFDKLLIPGIISLLSGIIIVILCINWRRSLSAYELNNRGKYEVINQLEKKLPAEMFECEYRYNTLNGIRSYSSREKKLPIIFICIGISLIILSAVLIAFGIKLY